MSRLAVRKMAAATRDLLGFGATPYIPIETLLDHALPTVLEDFLYTVEYRSEMGENHGLAQPDDALIRLREDVFVGAVSGKARDRFTVCHELGHLILHQRANLVLRRGYGAPQKPRHPEWQANTFAAEFLVDFRQSQGCKDEGDIVRRFGVSQKTASIQMSFIREGFRKK